MLFAMTIHSSANFVSRSQLRANTVRNAPVPIVDKARDPTGSAQTSDLALKTVTVKNVLVHGAHGRRNSLNTTGSTMILITKRGTVRNEHGALLNLPPLSLRLRAHLVEVVDGGHDLAEELARLAVLEPLLVVDVVVELAAARELHHKHDLLRVLVHCSERNVHEGQKRANIA